MTQRQHENLLIHSNINKLIKNGREGKSLTGY